MKKIFVLSIVGLLLINCAANRYNVAESYIEKGQPQNALKEYLKILHEDKRQHGGYTDTEAMLGAASAYYALKKYGKAQGICKRILKIDSNNGGALFYAGSSLETKGKMKWAIKFYKRYNLLPDHDPYKPFLKARIEMLMQEETAKAMRAAIRRERNINLDEIPQNTIAVLYFANPEQDPEWEPISKGLTEMMITDIAQVKKLKVIERIKLQKLIEEMNLGKGDLADPNTVPRFGKLLKARILINGAFAVPSGDDLLLTANLGDVTQKKSYEALRFTGRLADIFKMEKDLALSVFDQIGIELSYEERNRIMQIPTESLQAFKAYCFGLEQMDQGNYSGAADQFRDAVKLDPGYQHAQQKLQLVDAMNVLSSNTPVAASIKHAGRAGRRMRLGAPGRRGPSMRPNIAARLGRISSNLDLGYLPGNNSREDAAELSAAGVSIQRTELPPPPPPPDSR